MKQNRGPLNIFLFVCFLCLEACLQGRGYAGLGFFFFIFKGKKKKSNTLK